MHVTDEQSEFQGKRRGKSLQKTLAGNRTQTIPKEFKVKIHWTQRDMSACLKRKADDDTCEQNKMLQADDDTCEQNKMNSTIDPAQEEACLQKGIPFNPFDFRPFRSHYNLVDSWLPCVLRLRVRTEPGMSETSALRCLSHQQVMMH